MFKKYSITLALLWVFTLCLSCIQNTTSVAHQPVVTIEFLSVGQGNATLIVSENHTLLVDAGPDNQQLLQHLQSRNIQTLDAVIITHKDRDHFGGLFDILSHIQIEKIYLPADVQSKYHWDSLSTLITTLPQQTLLRGMTLPGIPSLNISVLWPLDNTTSGNNASTVLHLANETTSLLLTGDLDEAGEAQLLTLNKGLTIDILQVAHHGSYTSSSLSFISQLLPKYSIISVGRDNSYGHPHASTLSHLSRYTTDSILRTDRDSTITIDLHPHTFTIETAYPQID